MTTERPSEHGPASLRSGEQSDTERGNRPNVKQLRERIRATDAWMLLIAALPAFILSRLCVLVGAAVVAAELKVDANIALQTGTTEDPHGVGAVGSAIDPVLNVLTSWDGRWYMDVVRHGYPKSIPADVTYFQDEARAAFFPLFPILGRWFDRIIPFGDTFAVLLLNLILGLVATVLIALLAQRIYGDRVAKTTAVLVALFPGSFVLSFAYSEALMIVLAAATLLMLHDREWTAAGVFAAFCTASRPNGLAIVVACLVAAWFVDPEDRDSRRFSAVLLAPLGFITFQLWLGAHTGEMGAWFRVQREAWGEGASFGWTALKNTFEAFAAPMTSPTDTITAVTVAATIALVYFGWKAKLPWPLMTYSWAILALMLTPATVTARPRFLFTAFPLLIGAAWWFEERRKRNPDDMWFPLTLGACGAGLTALTGLYGVFGAIP